MTNEQLAALLTGLHNRLDDARSQIDCYIIGTCERKNSELIQHTTHLMGVIDEINEMRRVLLGANPWKKK